MNTNSIKAQISKGYGELAKSVQKQIQKPLFSCCATPSTVVEVGKNIGYSEAEMDSVPENSNLGVGCGNPSALARIQAGQTVVDLGSGAGFDAFLVARKLGEEGQVIGIDLSEDMNALAKKNAQKGGYSNVSFQLGDIEDIPLENELADHVISNCVINLTPNKQKVFEEAFRILKPGGELSISDVILEQELPTFIQNSLAGYLACVAGAEKLDRYMEYIRLAGFEEITIEQKSDFPLDLMMMDPQLQQLSKKLQMDLDSAEVQRLASRVKSVAIKAKKLA